MRLRIGEVQAAAVGIYIIDADACALEGDATFPGRLVGDALFIDGDISEAADALTAAANSADDDGDRQFRDALTTLARRARRRASDAAVDCT